MQTDQTGSAVLLAVYLALMIVVVAGMWKMMEKANQPGWGILIPIYNVILLLRVAGKPTWWIILMLIPLVNIVIAVLTASGIAKNFGRGGGFTVGLILLPMIFYPILGFGSAEYCPEGVPLIGSGVQPA